MSKPFAIPFDLRRKVDGVEKRLVGQVIISQEGIELYFYGYGTSDMQPGFGRPVYIEPGDDGHPVLLAWADIKSQDPTDRISFSRAVEPQAVT